YDRYSGSVRDSSVPVSVYAGSECEQRPGCSVLDDTCGSHQRGGRNGSPDRLAGSAGDGAIDSMAAAAQAGCAADRRSAVDVERRGHPGLPEVVAATALLGAGED